MTINSKAKGKAGELELCRVLGAAGFPARRGVQYQGGPDSPDVVCSVLPGIHFEAKRCEALRIYEAIEQARRDAGPARIPVVAHRRNDCEWLAVLRLDDLLDILKASDYANRELMIADALRAIGGEIEEVKQT